MVQKLELERINEKEFCLGENKIIMLNDTTLYVQVVGEQTDEAAEILKAKYPEVFSLFPGKIKHLIDLNRSGKSTPAARRVYKELNDHVLTEKVAVFGMSPLSRILASFVMGLSTKKNIRFFPTKEEALSWLDA